MSNFFTHKKHKFSAVQCSSEQDFLIQTLREKSQDHNLALGSERESQLDLIGLSHMFEYWSHFTKSKSS